MADNNNNNVAKIYPASLPATAPGGGRRPLLTHYGFDSGTRRVPFETSTPSMLAPSGLRLAKELYQ